jgi:hypothetical protein
MIIDFSRSMYWKDEHRKDDAAAATFTTHSTTPTLWWTL